MSKGAHYVEEKFPAEFMGKNIHEIDFIGWLNDKLKEGKTFHGFLPNEDFVMASAIFLVGEDDEQG